MQHRFYKCQLSIEIPLMGETRGIATSTGSFFTGDKGYSITYDDQTQLVTISKDGYSKIIHVAKVNTFDPMPEAAKPAKPQNQKPAPKES